MVETGARRGRRRGERRGAGAGQRFESGGEVGFPQLGALRAYPNGQGQVAWLIGALVNLKVAFGVQEVVNQRAERRKGIGGLMDWWIDGGGGGRSVGVWG